MLEGSNENIGVVYFKYNKSLKLNNKQIIIFKKYTEMEWKSMKM